ncbi:MAG: tRNA (N(6)-L-threonylcarbamoyladenosine(37)-C(2))-methylthiotransferase [archaeon]
MKNIFMSTYGCSSNTSDSEIMAGLLKESGYSLIGNIDSADIVLINTCVVKGATESKVKYAIQQLVKKYPEKKLVIAGCMSESEPGLVKNIAPGASLLGPHHITDVSETVKETLAGRRIERIGKRNETKLLLPKCRTNPLIDTINIGSGCMGSCSFCIARLARGSLQSFPLESIVEETKRAIQKGCREIRLTGQDTGIYGADTGTSLPSLLSQLSTLPGEFRIRVGMMNPNGAKKILPELIRAFESEKVYKFLHVPVQSGSNKVLQDMKRPYSITDFKQTVSKFRKACPSLTLATDIIVGYPTETEKDFQKTLDLVKDVKPDIINISRFAPRPGTEAAKLEKLPSEVLKARSRIMTRLAEKTALKNNKKSVGKFDLVLLTEKGKGGTVVGRGSNYKSVVLDHGKLGLFYQVKFTEAHSTYLRAVPA